jgi:hypothetical protein
MDIIAVGMTAVAGMVTLAVAWALIALYVRGHPTVEREFYELAKREKGTSFRGSRKRESNP